MPKKQILGTIIIIIILSFICMYIYDNYKVEIETNIIAEASKGSGIKEYYKDSKKNTYYLYDLNNIIIDFHDRTLDLDRALESKQIDLDFIMGHVEKKYSLNNEKIIFYQDTDFSLLQCTKEDGKINYIFGPLNMDYKEELCYEQPYICTFNKTYSILDISPSKKANIYYLTLSDSNEVETIQVENKYINELVVGNTYIFTFGSLNETIEDNIKDIFINNTLLSVQIETMQSDNICK